MQERGISMNANAASKKHIVLFASLLVFLVQMTVYAEAKIVDETEGQKRVSTTGLSVEWIDPLNAYGAVSYDSLGEKDSEDFCLALAKTPEGRNICAYINENGELAIPTIYDNAEPFFNGVARVTENGRRILIDSSGKELFDISKYDSVFLWSTGLVKVVSRGGTGLVDRNANEILPVMYNYNYLPLPGGLIGVEKEELTESGDNITRYDILDPTGKALVGTKYDGILPDDDIDGNLVIVKRTGKWGAIDLDGTPVVPFKYDSIEKFSEGLAVAAENGKYGYIDKTGAVTIPFIYDYAQSFCDGKASVLLLEDGLYNRHYLIDRAGNTLIGPKEYGVYWKGALIGLHSDFTSMNIPTAHDKIKREALLDDAGNRVTGFSYFNISDFHDGLAIVLSQYYPEGKGIINRYGAEIVTPIFNYMEMVKSNACLVLLLGETNNAKVSGRLGILELPADATTRRPSYDRPITVILNGVELYFDVEPIIVDNRTMVPTRNIFNALEADVSWDESGRKLTTVKGDVTIELEIGSTVAFVNGDYVNIDASPFYGAVFEPLQPDSTTDQDESPLVQYMISEWMQDRVLVPVRFVAEALNCNVTWENEYRIVKITQH